MSKGPNQPKDVTCYFTLILMPIVNIYVDSTAYYMSYFGFCPWHLSLRPESPWNFLYLGLLASVVCVPFPGP